MSMVTRCPQCATVFRVTPQQLQTRQGQVRCGRCMKVFDGFSGLAAQPDRSQAGEAAGAAGRIAPPPSLEPAAEALPESPPPAIPAAPPPSRPQPPQPDPRPTPVTRGSPEILWEPPEPPVEETPARRSWGWTAGSFVLLLALAAQAIYTYRSELVAIYPPARALIARACSAPVCNVPLPQRPRSINIEASDLQMVDPSRPQVIQLTATLRNHAGVDVAYPALDLVLTNTKEHTLARRIFMPEDYVERVREIRMGIPANAEITVRLDMDTGDLNAAGFRLGLLPAPRR
jgi:predicted Zn finger-like uncharacterized protein